MLFYKYFDGFFPRLSHCLCPQEEEMMFKVFSSTFHSIIYYKLALDTSVYISIESAVSGL